MALLTVTSTAAPVVDKQEVSHDSIEHEKAGKTLIESDRDRARDREKEIYRPECLICCDHMAVMATVPCGHKILCQQCVVDIGDKLHTCYLCQTELMAPKCIKIFD